MERMAAQRHGIPHVIGLVAVLLLAGMLRAVGHFPDRVFFIQGDYEPETVLPAVGMFSGSLLPPRLLRAGSIYPLHLAYRADYAIGRLLGRHGSAEEYAARYFVDPTHFMHLFWLLSVAAGVAATAAAYAAAAAAVPRKWALLAGLVVAVHPWTIYRADLPEALPLMLAAVSLWLLLRRRARPSAIPREAQSAFAVGLATAAKLYALPLAGGLAVHGLLRLRRRCGPTALACLAAFAVGFMVLAPFAIVNYRDSMDRASANNAAFEAGHTKPPHVMVGHLAAGVVRPMGLGPLAGVLAVVGLVVCARRPRPWRVALIVSPLLVFLLFVVTRKYQRHWSFVAVPSLAVLAAIGSWWIARLLSVALPRAGRIVCVGAIVSGLLPQAAQIAVLFAQHEGSTRGEAQLWVEEHVAPGTQVLLLGARGAVPRLRPDQASLEGSGWTCRGRTGCADWVRQVQRRAAVRGDGPPAYHVLRAGEEGGLGNWRYQEQDVARDGSLSPVLRDSVRERLAAATSPVVAITTDDSDPELAAHVRGRGRLLARFAGAPMAGWARAISEMPGFVIGGFESTPDIEIWELSPAGDREPGVGE